ncbi:Wadjet anti-phage system protein JetD domain-containing protein [Gordonibacter massiliensis (ex Traore et al. 2017)]|uniref:Wadjet anti-phage system protein JetD domain-containing protein n=1 Tax=Gordonibacter massiliensis (ex Traore et al. 2017) TaxID=1841863 RepID=UPI001C8CC775|nr:Wadjet anti-phage system protein JetD domain-containing protein [Gordonibacter massiliensis (ex Traore et al. 2017)]MBX9034085.1 hypothetical protein [Gordonibacter massiliensis (ex Traore et al. 2017)]
MLKSPREIEKRLVRIFDSDWHAEACGLHKRDWPHRIALGSPTKGELEADFGKANLRISELADWARDRQCAIESTKRRVSGTVQTLPTHIVIDDFEALARVVGGERQRKYWAGRRRAAALLDLFPIDRETCSAVIRQLADKECDEVDFELLCRATSWFARNDAGELTARQVPLDGFHAKWLDAKGHLAMIRLLCGNPDLQLKDRPRSAAFTYLDPAYLEKGGRWRDSITEGDASQPAYQPRIVVISENKDTALWFPPLPEGVSFEGGGWNGIEFIGAQDWVRAADLLVYWGDIDAAGLEILNGYRSKGLEISSIFMDGTAYHRYERYGTFVNKRGEEIKPKKPAKLEYLTEAERELYLRLVDPAWTRPRRIEQERIPLERAAEAVMAIWNGRMASKLDDPSEGEGSR